MRSRPVLAAVPMPHDEPTIADVWRVLLETRGMVEQLLEHRPASSEERHARLLAALAEAMEELDLPFSTAEVLHHADVHHALAEALQACCPRTTTALGALFRELRDRDLDGLTLIRDGRLWRLASTRST